MCTLVFFVIFDGVSENDSEIVSDVYQRPGTPDAVSTERCSTANLQPEALRPYRRQYYVKKQTAVCEICCLLLAVACALLVNAASFILMFAFVHEI